MTDATPNLGLPYIEAGQAQKHVTHNEALRILDAAIQIAVRDLDRTSPPSGPAEGERNVVAAGATGAWAGQDHAIATWQDAAWAFLAPQTGWCVWSAADNVMFVFDGSAWRDLRDLPVTLDNAVHVGINTTAAAPNLLAVKSNAALFTAIKAADGGSGDMQLQLSKEAAANAASVVFSDNYSGRAEFGLSGDDNFHLKVSPDGSGWTDAVIVDKATGKIALAGFTDQAATRISLAAAPIDALSFCGMQINGNVDVSQENVASAVTLASGTAKYIADCWEARYVHAANTAVVTGAQLAAASFPSPLAGYANGFQLKATTALSAPANGDCALHRQQIEGYRVARLGWGAASAKPIGYAFQFFSSVAGVAFVKVCNDSRTRCFYQEFAVAAGWNFVTGTVPGDTAGTWQTTIYAGLIFEIFSAGKTAAPAAPAIWSSVSTTQTTNSGNLLAANGNQTIVTGLLIVPGVELPPAARAPFIMRPYDQESILCRRHYRFVSAASGPAYSSANLRMSVNHPGMRIAPAPMLAGPMNFTDVVFTNPTQSAANVSIQFNTADGGMYDFGNLSGLTSQRIYFFLPAGQPLRLDARL